LSETWETKKKAPRHTKTAGKQKGSQGNKNTNEQGRPRLSYKRGRLTTCKIIATTNHLSPDGEDGQMMRRQDGQKWATEETTLHWQERRMNNTHATWPRGKHERT